jgi:hypothetical protein
LISKIRDRKEKSSTFATEIHSRNGLILFRRILVVSVQEGYPDAFLILRRNSTTLPAQLTATHLKINLLTGYSYQLCRSSLKLNENEQQESHAGHFLLPAIPREFFMGKPPAFSQ